MGSALYWGERADDRTAITARDIKNGTMQPVDLSAAANRGYARPEGAREAQCQAAVGSERSRLKSGGLTPASAVGRGPVGETLACTPLVAVGEPQTDVLEVSAVLQALVLARLAITRAIPGAG